jgi:uncharacterized protein with PIN domain
MKVCPYCNKEVNGLAKHVVIEHPERSHESVIFLSV